YGLMQLISETYALFKTGLGLDNDRLAAVYDSWDKGELNSFLIEITAHIFRKDDDKKTGKRLIDVIRPVARQKGTGLWTSVDALELQVPIPVIDAAVMMRDLSGRVEEREAAARTLTGLAGKYSGDKEGFVTQVRNAYHAALTITYAQGMAMLRKASGPEKS